MTYKEIISRVQNCSIVDDNEFDLFIDDIGAAVEGLELSTVQRDHLNGELIANIEKQPEPEFTSWSLLHFMEWLDNDNTTNYNQQILESLKRKPKVMTLLLANRIINGVPSVYTTLLLNALKESASNNTLDDYVRKQARDFYDYQMKKKTKN